MYDQLAKIVSAYEILHSDKSAYDKAKALVSEAAKATGENGFNLLKTIGAIKFDLTLLGLDLNVGASPVVDIKFDAKDISYVAKLTSTENLEWSKVIAGTVGDDIFLRSSEVPYALDTLSVQMNYRLDAGLTSKLALGIDAGMDMKALGISGEAFDNELPPIPVVIDSGEIKGDSGYLIHLPTKDSDDSHYAYDLYSSNIDLLSFAEISLGASVGADSHMLLV